MTAPRAKRRGRDHLFHISYYGNDHCHSYGCPCRKGGLEHCGSAFHYATVSERYAKKQGWL